MILLSGNKFKPLESAAAAFALKRIAGVSSAIPILKARRVTAGDEIDIFDLSGTAYKTSLSGSWIESGAENFYIRKWYDQSGNNRYAEQTTPNNQPKLDFSSGNPHVLTDGTNDGFNLNFASITGGVYSFVFKINCLNLTAAELRLFLDIANGSETNRLFFGVPAYIAYKLGIRNNNTYSFFDYNNQKIIFVCSNNQTKLYLNGVLSATVAYTPFDLTSPAALFKHNTLSAGYFKGTCDNILIYNKALTAAEIVALNNIF